MAIGTILLGFLSKAWKPLLIISLLVGTYAVGYYKGSSNVKNKAENVALQDEIDRRKDAEAARREDSKTKEEIDAKIEEIVDSGGSDELADYASELLSRDPTKED